jgi:adenine phosphoribosyltransferase
MLAHQKAIADYLNTIIRTIPDFPKPGIQFKDITPLLRNPEALRLTTEMLVNPFMDQNIDIIVGLESRGFLFGTNMASELHAGFVPVRKPNKLPSDKIFAEYQLEYGNDRVEMHSDAIKPGEKVIIHDDLIATGGTAAAATELVEKLGGIVVGYSFIIELGFLNGKEKLAKDVPVYSLITL